MTNRRILNARENRKRSTKSEGLLWSVLRGNQLCELKFRREHPIGNFIADFACEASKLVVEIDGGYHNQIGEKDIEREKTLRSLGWDVIRFSDNDVEQDAEAVARAIAKHLQLEYSFKKRNGGSSGMKVVQPSPKPGTSASTLPREGE